jgi:hypothetical protein
MFFSSDRAKRCPWMFLLLVGCYGGDNSVDAPDDLFNYATTSNLSVDVRVTVDGAPASFARIQISDTLQADANGELPENRVNGTIYFAGLTDQDGRLTGEFQVPEIIEQVAVVAHVPGASGLYSEPLLRSAWGPFAPSARIHVSVNTLDTIELALVTE